MPTGLKNGSGSRGENWNDGPVIIFPPIVIDQGNLLGQKRLRFKLCQGTIRKNADRHAAGGDCNEVRCRMK